jgi:predicted nucleic acid-binding protein
MTLPSLVVSDTSPVSALVMMGWLDWLRQRWQALHVQEMVWLELRRRSSPADWEVLEDARCQGWLRVVPVADLTMLPPAAADLHAGECEALALAKDLHAAWLLMDERDGRLVAQSMGIKVTGTVGIVLWAKAEGLIPSVREALNELRRQAGFFLKAGLIDEAARLAGEVLGDDKVGTPTDTTLLEE